MFSITPMTLEVDLARHVRGALRDLLRGRLRRGDDDHLGPREELRHRQRDVAGARGHVDDEVVGLAPVHVGEELLERLVQHRAAPHDGLVLACEEAHRDERHAVGLGRDDDVVDDRGRPVDAEHPRHREAPHVGVDRRDLVPAPASATARFVVTDDLPTPPLPDDDREHAGVGVEEGVGAVLLTVRPVRVAALQLLRERGALLVGHHREVDVDVPDARQGHDRVGDPAGDLGPQRAAGDGQRDRDLDRAAVDPDAPDHVQLDDRAVDLGVLDGAQGLEHLSLGRASVEAPVGRCGARRWA